MQIRSKEEIVNELQIACNELLQYCKAIGVNKFFEQPAEKWSIAQNITHLTTSARVTTLAYKLPKFIVRLYAGKPNRPSRSYEELIAKYKLKLQQGGTATGPFIPKKISTGQQKIFSDFEKKMEALINAIEKNWQDVQLDKYLAPHPLLGKITLRELGFFTIHHTYHHLTIIKSREQ